MIGFPEFEGILGAEIQHFGYRYADLLRLGRPRYSNLILLDFQKGFLPLPCAEDFRDLVGWASDKRITIKSDPLSYVFGAEQQALYNRICGFKDEALRVSWDDMLNTSLMSSIEKDRSKERGDRACRQFIDRHMPSTLQRVLGQIWGDVIEGALAVLVLPSPLGTGKWEERDRLFAGILPLIRVRDARCLNNPPVCEMPESLDAAAATFFAGHSRYIGGSRSCVEVSSPEQGAKSNRFSLRDFAPYLHLPTPVSFSPATSDGDGQARSMLIESGKGAVFLIPQGADTKGLAEFAVRCVLNPKENDRNGSEHPRAEGADVPRKGDINTAVPTKVLPSGPVGNVEIPDALVRIEPLLPGKVWRVSVGGHEYRITRKSCMAVIEALKSGEPRVIKNNPRSLFQHGEKTKKKKGKDKRGNIIEKDVTDQGDHERFADKHLKSMGLSHWRIVASRY